MAKTTAENLASIAASKEAIRQAIETKGQECSKSIPFSGYAGKIAAISTGMDFFMCTYHANGFWGGYKAVLENGRYRFEKTVTDGLKYTSVIPVIGKIYTEDALAEIAYLYDIEGCPNLIDCNEVSCPICGAKYCETHETHTHGSNDGNDDDDDDNNNDNNDNTNTGKECPFTNECVVVSCPDCNVGYCITHTTHDCSAEAYCPFTPECKIEFCQTCEVGYCAVHHPHTCASGCAVDDCDRTDFATGKTCSECGRTFCSYHANSETWTCDVCGLTFCTKNCYDAYTAHNGSHAVTCAVEGCDNTQASLTCHECGKIFCIDHASENTQHCDICQHTYCDDCFSGHTCNLS